MNGENTKKSVVITGASDGIGKALAWVMAERGYNLGLTARRLEVLEKLKAEIQKKYPAISVSVAAMDVCDYAQQEPVLTNIHQQLGYIDILVVNAGMAIAGRADTAPLADQLNVINTNLNGAIATVVAGLKLFRQQGAGHIVATSSVAAYRGLPGNAAYSASKAGLSTYMEGVRAETLRHNIDVTVLHPGYIDTAINRKMKSRPFVIEVEKGARIYADLIERKVASATVPRFPWNIVGPLLKILPTRVIAKM
jgi:short-subunit dehydrogenase